MLEGGVLESRYQLLSKLGEGSTGSVWRALDLKLERSVAVKLIEPRFVQTPEALARFQREARAAARLSGPNVAQIYDSGVHAGTPYLTMELLEGESLGQRIRTTGPLTAEATTVVFADMAQAVTKAHKLGIVHRNLKPDNVFLVWEDPGVRAVVLDFGVAKSLGGDVGALPTADSGSGLATKMPYYWSPEQMSGRIQVDYRTDLWALAVIAFECLTGRRPFEDQTLGGLLLRICSETAPIPSQWAAVPAGFDQWFARGVAKEPDARFQSAMEAAAELEQLCDGYVPPAGADGPDWQHPVAEAEPRVPAHLSQEPLATPVPLRAVSTPPAPRVTPIPAPVSRSVPVQPAPESESVGRRSEPDRPRVSSRPRPPMDSEDFGEPTPAERHRKTILMIAGAAALVLLGVAMTLLVSGGDSGAAAESSAMPGETAAGPAAPQRSEAVPGTVADQTGPAATAQPTPEGQTSAPAQTTVAAQQSPAPAPGSVPSAAQSLPPETTAITRRPVRASARTSTQGAKTPPSSARPTTKRATGSSASARLKSDLGL